MSSNFGTNPTQGQTVINVNADTTLSGLSYGKIFVARGNGGWTLTLPNLTVSNTSNSFSVVNSSAGIVTLQARGGNFIFAGGSGLTSLELSPGDHATLLTDNDSWLADTNSTKASLAGATFTGPVKVPAPSLSDVSGSVVSTQFLTDFLAAKGYAASHDAVLSGHPAAELNPPQFDSSQRLVTTSSAKASARQFGGVVNLLSGSPLDSMHYGKFVIYSGSSSANIALPDLGESASGQVVTVANYSSSSSTVVSIVGTIDLSGIALAQYSLRRGCFESFMNDRGQVWRPVGPGSYLNVIDAQSGWARSPDGLIRQWGVISNVSSPTSFNFHVTFPNSCVSVQAFDTEISMHNATAFPTSTSQFTACAGRVDNAGTPQYSPTRIRWEAKGY